MKSAFDKNLMHGRDYAGENLTGWIATEKFNGHRLRWQDGSLITRFGNLLDAPASFTAALPDVRMDIELFSTRSGGHDEVSSLIMRGEWRALSLVPFDLPDAAGGYQARNAGLLSLDLPGRHRPCAARILENNADAIRLLDSVVGKNGEGLMLHHPRAEYHPGRVATLLKLFPTHWHLAIAA